MLASFKLYCILVSQNYCKLSLSLSLCTNKTQFLISFGAINICRITEAMNSTRDHLSYFDVFYPYLETLESRSPPSPSQVITDILPSISAAMKQKEGMSRAYAHSGFLEVILIKVGVSWSLLLHSPARSPLVLIKLTAR